MFPASTDPARGASPHVTGGCAHPASLSSSTVVAVRRALHARRVGRPPTSRLQTAAALVADDARRQGLSPEAMLVAVKRTWAALDDVRHLPADDARTLLERLVSYGIPAYFAYRAEPPAATARTTDGLRAD